VQFKDIIGQQDAKQRLRMAIHEGRVAHALMFLGPEGCGNLPLALAFANYMSCTNRTEEDSCGACPTCKKFKSFQFADMFFSFPYFNRESGETLSDDWMGEWRSTINEGLYFNLDHWRGKITKDNKKLQFPVAEAGNIVRKLSLKSYEGGYKFMVLWLPEYMSVDTANKLLKIVEEPPEKTIFLFVAENSESILPTIQSRVQVIQIPKIKDEDLQQALLDNGADFEQAQSITHFADGNWWLAQQLAKSEDPNQFYSTQFIDWMRSCYKKDVIKLVKWADAMHQLSRDEQRRFLTYALDQIRQNLMLNYTGERLSRLNREEKEFSSKFSVFINDLNAMDFMTELTEAHNDIGRNIYSKLVFTDLSMKVHYLLMRKS
jgi:DNA polymerase III subunit delta'